MSFKLVSSGGNVVDPTVITMFASGVVRPGGIVCLDDSASTRGVYPGALSATAGWTTTNIFGVCLDYAQGASDTQVKVIPFASGQVWQADAVSAISTLSIGLRHQLATDSVVRNITSISETASTGVFLCLGVTGATTGSGKLLGTFLQRVPVFGKDGVTPTT